MTPFPHSFAQIIGQHRAKTMLTRALFGGVMAHAYLFRGPAGVGKKSLARAFAALGNCRTPQANDACATCPSCLKFQADSHPDFMVLDPQKGTIRIDQVRELKKNLQFPPLEGKTRFVLLPDIHLTMRRKEVANSLLKTLEEPPPNTVLILTADEAGGLLPTIVSRCQLIPFVPLPQAELAEILAAEFDLPSAETTTLAALTEGSLGRARELRASGLLEIRRQLIQTLLRTGKNDPTATLAILELAEHIAKRKDDLPELLELLATWFRDVTLHVMGMPRRMLINHDLLEFLEAAAGRWPGTKVADNLQRIDQARRQLLHNCRPALVCEVLFFAMQ